MKKYIYTELYEKYQLPLFRYLLQVSRDRQIAEDLLQETFYRAMVSLNVKNMMHIKAWLFKVARNIYIDSTRKSKSEQRMVERVKLEHSPISDLGNPEQELEKRTRQGELEEILSMLPERMQTIIYLREIQGFTYKELSTAMNLSEGQVKTTLHRARQKFRQYDNQLREGAEKNEKR